MRASPSNPWPTPTLVRSLPWVPPSGARSLVAATAFQAASIMNLADNFREAVAMRASPSNPWPTPTLVRSLPWVPPSGARSLVAATAFQAASIMKFNDNYENHAT
jgi:hypothetical protein